MTWYHDPRHPELGRMFMPDSEAAAGALPPGMETTARPPAEEIVQDEEFPRDIPSGWTQMGATDEGESWSGYSENLTRAYNGGILTAEGTSMYGADTPKAELDRRLAEGRCYGCGVKLNTDDPYEMFCSEGHEREWRRRTQADLQQGETFVDPDSSSGYNGFDEGLRTPDPGDTFPRWLGTPRTDLGPLNHTPVDYDPEQEPAPRRTADRETLGLTPLGWAATGQGWQPIGEATLSQRIRYAIHDVPTLPERYDLRVSDAIRASYGGQRRSIPTAYGLHLRPWECCVKGTVIPKLDQMTSPAATPVPNSLFYLGDSCISGEPALRELDRGPYGDMTGWPIAKVESLQRLGYAMAIAPGIDDAATAAFQTVNRLPILPLRTCPRCGQLDTPVCHEARSPEVLSAEGVQVNYRMATHIVCGACLMPYPGPMLVPLWREVPHGGSVAVELAVAHKGGHEAFVLSREAISQAAVDLTAMTWGALYRDAQEAATGWGCVVPGCVCRPRTWLSLAAPMRAWGWGLLPLDEEPLVMSLCPQHTYQLQHMIYSDRRMYTRTQTQLYVDPSRMVIA